VLDLASFCMFQFRFGKASVMKIGSRQGVFETGICVTWTNCLVALCVSAAPCYHLFLLEFLPSLSLRHCKAGFSRVICIFLS
jgi:hypothetical protein